MRDVLSLQYESMLMSRLPEPLRKAATALVSPPFNVVGERFGFRLAAPLSGYMIRGRNLPITYLMGTYEPTVCRTILRVVQPGSTCVDAGAHLGYFSLLLATCVGEQGHVFAFEAHPANALQVRTNAHINGLQARVHVENMAISDGIQQAVTLFAGRQKSSSEWNIVGHDLANRQTSGVLTIPATSLDAYFPEGSRLDFVKMDIEGAEARALHGMRDILRRTRPLLLIEFHDDTNWESRHHLLNSDFRLLDLSTMRWIDSPHSSPRVYQCLAVPKERADQIYSALQL